MSPGKGSQPGISFWVFKRPGLCSQVDSRLMYNQSRGHALKKGNTVICLIINSSLTNRNHNVLRVINFMFIFSMSANKAVIMSFYRWWNQVLKHLNNYLKATEIINGKAITLTQMWVGSVGFFLPYMFWLPKNISHKLLRLWSSSAHLLGLLVGAIINIYIA